ncbi:MAG: hypothetical protein L6455_05565 [Kiritimatiellae bacterium]|nr:hypothetical protein [Kiritimatiellia bacterium]
MQRLLDGLEKSGAVPSSATVQRLIDLDAQAPQLMEAVRLLREKVAASSDHASSGEQYRMDIVKLLMKAGRHHEALQEARVLLSTCSDKTMPAAIALMARLFTVKTADTDLDRANKLKYY